MLHRLQIRRTALVAATLLLGAPAPALAAGGTVFTVGPVKARHGYAVSALGEGCDTSSATGSISFGKTTDQWSQTHSYSPAGGKKPQCHIARNLSFGSMTFSLGRMAKVNITFRKHGQIKKAPLPPGCSGPSPETAFGIATGTFTVKVLPRFFGKVRLRHVRASVTKIAYTCRPTRLDKKTIFLTATTGTPSRGLSLTASRLPGGPSAVSLEKYGPFAKGISATHFLTITGGTSLFEAQSNLDTARVVGSAKPLRGQLKFTATPSCKGKTRIGRVAGSLKINFDTLPTQELKGAPTTYPAISKGEAGTPCSGPRV